MKHFTILVKRQLIIQKDWVNQNFVSMAYIHSFLIFKEGPWEVGEMHVWVYSVCFNSVAHRTYNNRRTLCGKRGNGVSPKLLSHDTKARATEEMCSCFLTALRYSRFKLGRINYEGVSNPSYNQHILRCSQYTGLQLCRTVGHIVKLSCRAELFDYI